MGEVFLAEDARLKRRVAIKRVRSDVLDPAAQRRLLIEARTAGQLDHPNICPIFEIGEDDQGPYIVMPFVDGEPLSIRMTEGGMPIDEAVAIAIQMADALSAAHAQGILHRDIKPANVMIDRRGQARVMDFGLAKFASDPSARASGVETVSRLTASGGVVGTVAYMSPEQARGEAVDARSDLFSLGVVLYEMITGRRPFTGGTAADMTVGILTVDPPAAGRLRPEVPQELERILAKSLRKRKDERYQSAGDLRVDLEAVRASMRSAARTGTAPEAEPGPVRTARLGPRNRAQHVALAALLVVIAGALAGTFLWRRGAVAPGHEVARIQSIAVLPLENHSSSEDQEYFADGMTEALTTELARIKSLHVLSRTSTFKYKGTTMRLPEIAAELGADAVVEGSVLRDRDKVRITAQLIHGSSDRHLWAESYDGDMADIMALQRRVAQAIAREVRATVLPGVDAARDRRIDPRARDEYLRAREQFYAGINARGDRQVHLERAVEHYRKAIQIQGDWAEPWAGMAQARHWMGGDGGDHNVRFPQAREAAQKALSLDDNVSIAHGALAYVSSAYDWDFVTAEREFKRTMELNPSDEYIHGYAIMLMMLGRHDDAIDMFDRAERLDPLQIPLRVNATYARVYAGHFEEALRRIAWIESDGAPMAPFLRATTSSLQGRHADALRVFRARWKERPSPGTGADLVCTLARAGQSGEARQLLAGMDREISAETDLAVAAAHASLGEAQAALAALEFAVKDRQPWIAVINVDHCFDPIRSHPGFQDLLVRIGVRRSP